MSRRTRNLYAWKHRTEDGHRRQVEAQMFASQWTVRSRRDDEEEWTVHDPPLLDDLEALEEKVFSKYQRGSNPWKHVLSVRALIAAQGGLPGHEGSEDDES